MPSETENSPENPEVSSFADDQPIVGKEHDKLDRAEYARRIAKMVRAPEPKSGMVVGIYGAWGEGKTSLLRMIEEELNVTGHAICVRFNPWQFGNEERLLKGFFATLGDELGRSLCNISENIGHLLRQYGGLLSFAPVPLFGGLIQVSAGGIAKEIGKNLSNVEIGNLKKKIEDILLMQNRRVVVFIDDIDRLDRDELHEIFKLVKNTADFKNTTYVLAFDRDAVAASIGERYSGGGVSAGRDFLEKIIQVPLPLPKANSNSINQFFHTEVMRAFEINGVQLDESQIIDIFRAFNQAFENRPVTLRQIIRYVNGLTVALFSLKGEVHLTDLVMIEAVRHFFPDLHKFIRENSNVFLKGSGSVQAHNKHFQDYFLKRIDGTLNDLDVWEKDNLIEQLIVRLFPKSSDLFGKENLFWDTERCVAEQRICSEYHFNLYFSYDVARDDVSDVEIHSFLASLKDKSEHDVDAYVLSKINGESFSQFAIKLIHYRKRMPVAATKSLAMSFARLSRHISHERGIYTAIDEAVSVVDAMLQAQKTVNECITLAEDVINASSSLVLAGQLFASICKWSQDSGDLIILAAEPIENLGALLANRVKDAIQQNFFFDQIDRTEILLIVLKDYGGNEAKVILETSFNTSGENLDKFLRGIVGFHFSSGAAGPQPNEMDKDHYDSICRLIEPKVIIRMLKARYGEKLDDLKYKTGRDMPLNLKFARQFLYIHKEKQAQSPAPTFPLP